MCKRVSARHFIFKRLQGDTGIDDLRRQMEEKLSSGALGQANKFQGVKVWAMKMTRRSPAGA